MILWDDKELEFLKIVFEGLEEATLHTYGNKELRERLGDAHIENTGDSIPGVDIDSMAIRMSEFTRDYSNNLENLDRAQPDEIWVVINAILAGIPEELTEEDLNPVVQEVLITLRGLPPPRVFIGFN